jgi:dihydrofolate reductase
MGISLIVAYSKKDYSIGLNNQLLWNLPNDMKHFKNITMNKVIVMGRKTYQSIGRILPNRMNVILTRNDDFKVDGAMILNSKDDVLELSKTQKSDILVIGGAEIYSQFMDVASIIYATEVDFNETGDSFFPKIGDEWVIENKVENKRDWKHYYDYNFITYKRK